LWQAAVCQTVLSAATGQQLGQGIFAKNLVDAFGGAGYRRCGDEWCGWRRSVRNASRDGPERIVRDQGRHMGQFGGLGAQKFASSWEC
jgi:hypothetical protein